MVELGVRDLGPAPGLSVSVRLDMDAAEGTQVRVLLRIDVDRVRIPCPYVHEPEVRMEEHELRTSLGMDLGAASGGRAGEIAIVPVVTARLVLEPPSAWKLVGRPVRHRIFDGGELHATPRRLGVNEHRGRGEIHTAREERQQLSIHVHEVNAVPGLHAADLNKPVGPRPVDVEILRRRLPNRGQNRGGARIRLGDKDGRSRSRRVDSACWELRDHKEEEYRRRHQGGVPRGPVARSPEAHYPERRRLRDGRLAELADIIDEMAPHRSGVQPYRTESHRFRSLFGRARRDERDEEATTR